MPRKPLPSLQTHAALPTTELNTDKNTFAALRSVVGTNAQSIRQTFVSPVYSTSDEAVYSSFINSLELSALQDHAVRVGSVIPCDDRDKLIANLSLAFTRYYNKVGRYGWA